MSKKEKQTFKETKVGHFIFNFKDTKVGRFVHKFPEVVAGPLMIIWLFVLIAIATRGFGVIPANGHIAIAIGSLSVAWYAIFILTGILFAAVYAYYEFPKLGITRNDLTDGLLPIVPISIIGARLYYVIFDPNKSYKSFLDVINLTDGGLAIHGAIIAAVISVIVFARIKKIRVWYLFDTLVIGFLIGQIIGRWGNFMNQEAYGPVVENSWVFRALVPGFVKKNMLIDGAYHHPTFLYESFLNFIALVGLLVVRRFRLLKVGDGLGIYLILYGIIRGAVIEPMRMDPLYIFGLKVNVLFSLTLFAGGGIIYLILKYIFAKDLPYYYDLAIDSNLYIKGLEGKEYRKREKEAKKAAKQAFHTKMEEEENKEEKTEEL